MSDEKREENSLTNVAEVFFTKTKYLWIGLICAVVVALLIVLIVTKVSQTGREKCADYMDDIVFSYETNKDKFEGDAALEAENEFLEKLEEFCTKYGKNRKTIRAYMTIAKIHMERKEYAESLSYWEKACGCDKKSYLAGISNFNAAVCFEQENNLEQAKACYMKAADNKNFIPKPHALFCAARVSELQEMKDEAINIYGKIIDSYAEDEWAKLAKSRIIALSSNE
ncbi:MAG: tetratricopeptide repeat protein [Treponemataceae bacterium]